MADYFSRALGQADPAAPADPVAPPAAQPATDYFGRAMGSVTPAATGGPADPNATPDAPTWVGRRVQDLVGKHDPRYRDVPAFDLHESGIKGGFSPEAGALALGEVTGADDAAMADIIGKQLGDRFIGLEKDANGYPLVRYRDPQGKEALRYVNKPGLDMGDVQRNVVGAVPYLVTGGGAGAVAKALPTVGKMIVQGATAAATNIAAQFGRQAAGSEQGLDPAETAYTAAGGAAGEFAAKGLGAIYRRFVVEPSLFDRSTGQLTAKGAEIASKAGVDTTQIEARLAQEFAQTYAKSGNAAEASLAVSKAADGVPASRGQYTKRPDLLHSEEAMRRGIYGDDARQVMEKFDSTQQQALIDRAAGSPGSRVAGTPSIVDQIAPNVNSMGRSTALVPGAAGPEGAIQARTAAALNAAKQAENAAWTAARAKGTLEPTKDALDLMPSVFENSKVASVIDAPFDAMTASRTPTALRMVRELEDYQAGNAPKAAASPLLKPDVATDVDAVRKRLFKMSQSATDPADRRAASEVYKAYDDWMQQAAGKALLMGDVDAVAAYRTARDATVQLKQIFEPRDGGKLTPEAKIIQKLVKSGDNPETIAAKLFGGQRQETADATVPALQQLKKAYDTYLPPDGAKEAWDNLKLAYWGRLVRSKNGSGTRDIGSPQEMLTNINYALSNQPSLIRTLFTPSEQRIISQFRSTLQQVTYRPPNPSGTSYGVAGFAKEAISAIVRGLGLNVPAQIAARYLRLDNVYGSVQARRAVSGAVSAVRNPTTGNVAAGATNSLYQQDR